MPVLLIVLTFTFNSLAQTPQDDPQQGDFFEDAKVRPGKVNVYDIKYSPDGTRLAVAGNFGILLYDVRTDDEPIKVAEHTGRAVKIAFSRNGNMIARASFSNTIRLWDMNTGQLLRTLIGHKTLSDWCIAFSPDGKTIAIRDLEKKSIC